MLLDANEPHTVTMEDEPNTDFDESGHYWLDGLEADGYTVREVVPDGFSQTFPEDGFHRVVLEAGDAVEGVDFGNRRGMRCDIDENESVDLCDIRLIVAARNQPARPGSPRDIDADGTITGLDARRCVLACDRARCAP